MSGTTTEAPPAEPAAAAPAAPAPAKETTAAAPAAPAATTAVTEGAKPPVTPAAKPVVPDKYEFKLADGMQLDEALVKAATPVLKKHGLSQEAAQELFDLYNGHLATLTPQLHQQFEAALEANRVQAREAGHKALLADKKYDYEKATQGIGALLKKYDPKGELVTGAGKVFADLKIGNDPGLHRFLAAIAKDMAEDSFHGTGGGGTQTDQDAQLRAMFPNSPGMFEGKK